MTKTLPPNAAAREQRAAYRPDIDGLRALAVTVVVLYHAGIAGFGGGFVGVDVFFVISGFLITRLLRDELARTGTLSLRDFYARRVRRLLPALLVVVLATIALWIGLLPGLSDPTKFSRSLRWALGGFANLFFKRNTNGYFDGPTAEMPLLHLWSLAVEEQFYLCWPLLLVLAERIFRGREPGRSRTRTAVLGLASVFTVVSFARATHLIARGPQTWAFYEMPARAWELGVGALLTFALDRRPAPAPEGDAPTRFLVPRKALATGLGAAGLGGVLFAVFTYTPGTPFPGPSALPPVLGTALLIAAGALARENFVSREFARAALVRLGGLSYGWYLWHWPLFAVARVSALGEEPSLATRAALALASLVLAELSLRFVEIPIRVGPEWKRIPAFRMIAIGAVASGLVALLGSQVPRLEVLRLESKVGKTVTDAVLAHPKYGADCFSVADFGTAKCDFDFGGAGAARPRLAVWGDSHACSYFPLATDYAKTHGLSASLYCAGKTAPLTPSYLSEAVFADLRKKTARGPVSVVLAARWMLYSGKPAISRTTPVGDGSLPTLAAGLERTLSGLEKVGVARVLIVLPGMELPYSTLRCLLRAGCAEKRAEIEAYRAEVVGVLTRIAARHAFARVVDPLPPACAGEECPVVLGGIPATVDDNHPTVPAVERFARAIPDELDWFAGVSAADTSRTR